MAITRVRTRANPDRSGRWSPAIIGVITAIAVAVIDSLTAKIGPALAEEITVLFNPPHFSLKFTEPVEIKSLILRRIQDDPSTAAPAEYRQESQHLLVVKANLADYIMTLTRDQDGQEQNLVDTVHATRSGQDIEVDTASQEWADVDALQAARETGTDETATPFLLGTRWMATANDYETLGTVGDASNRLMLSVALSEVGSAEGSNQPRSERVKTYWTAVANRESPDGAKPWGGAFLSWVAQRAGFKSPQSAALEPWANWGKPVDSIEPGRIVVFAAPTRQGTTTLFVGVVLRPHKNCTEVIAGNISDRVVITCVAAKPLAVREGGTTTMVPERAS